MATDNTDQKYLSLEGLKTFWGKIKEHVTKETNALKTELRGGNDADTLKTLRTAIDSMSGDSGAINNAINTAIGKLDYTDTAAPGKYVSSVSETDGIIAVTRTNLPTYSVTDSSDFVSVASNVENGNTVFTISTSNIAKADELATLKADVRKLDNDKNGRVTLLEGKVAALASATHFIGVKTELPATAANGDVVIVGEKEYIYSKPSESATGEWKELGDTSAEQARIGALETTVGAAAQGEGKPATGLVGKVEALEKAVGGSSVVNTFGGESGTISVDTAATGEGNVKFTMDGKKLTATVDIGATATQGDKADSAVQSGNGVDGNHTTTTIEKDGNKALNIRVDVATVTDYTTDSTDIPTAGSVMTKINAAITNLNKNNDVETNVIDSIVTGVNQVGGKITVTKSAFKAITDNEINALFN